MNYDKIDGMYLPSLLQMFSHVNELRVSSVNDIKRVASLLMAFEPYLKGTSDYLNKHVKQAKDNLTTKSILESIIQGKNITPLMEVGLDSDQLFGNADLKNYDWKTNKSEHLRELNLLRKLGNTMYKDVHTAFSLTNEHQEMRERAEDLRDKWKPDFDYWQSVVELSKDEAVEPASVEDLAKFISKETDPSVGLSLSPAYPKIFLDPFEPGLSALMYLALKNKEKKEITNLIKDSVEKYLSVFPKTRKYKSVRKALNNWKRTIERELL